MNVTRMIKLSRPAAASLCAVLLASGALASCMTNGKEKSAIGSPDMGSVADGVWRGAYSAAPVMAEVEVTVAGHRIESIRIVKHRTLKGVPAERIVASVVAAQSLRVDIVSGATRSSRCILKAIEVALGFAAGGSVD